MTEFTTTVTRKGQITVPAAIRRSLGLKVGDTVALSVPEPGTRQSMLRPVPSVADRTYGSVPPRAVEGAYDDRPSAFGDAIVDEALEESQHDTTSRS